MQPVGWIQRLLASTRGEIIRLLRRSSRTVTELADALGLTDNAVRTHLAALERDGLVRQEEAVRRGVGKPPFVYSLTAQADALLPKAYAPALGILLGVLEERLGAAEVEAVLREVGRRAAAPTCARAWRPRWGCWRSWAAWWRWRSATARRGCAASAVRSPRWCRGTRRRAAWPSR